jgi:hypothetical protein
MYRVVAFAIGGMILLVVDVAAVYVAVSSSALLLALLLCLPGLVLVWALLAVRFGQVPGSGVNSVEFSQRR